MDQEDKDVIVLGAASPASAGMLAWALGSWEVFFWLLWISAFLIVEVRAVFNAKLGDTFSESWWRYLRIKTGTVVTKEGHTVAYEKPWPMWFSIPLRIAIVAFGIWLIGHLGFGLWGGE